MQLTDHAPGYAVHLPEDTTVRLADALARCEALGMIDRDGLSGRANTGRYADAEAAMSGLGYALYAIARNAGGSLGLIAKLAANHLEAVGEEFAVEALEDEI